MVNFLGLGFGMLSLRKIGRRFLRDLSRTPFLLFNLLSNFFDLVDVLVDFGFVFFVQLFDLLVHQLLVGFVICAQFLLGCFVFQLLSLQDYLSLSCSINGLICHFLEFFLPRFGQ